MALYELIYVSAATADLSQTDLSRLMEQSRLYNARHGITGVLLYHRREFMQLIEGDEAEIRTLFERICVDERHQQVDKMWEGPIAERNCADWAMGLVAGGDDLLRGRPGYEPLLAQGLIASTRDTTGKKLLLCLRDDFLVAD